MEKKKSVAKPTYLECDPKVATVGIRSLFPDLALPGATQYHRRPGTLRHETRGLQVCLLQVDIPVVAANMRRADERSALLSDFVHLQDLPLDEIIDHAGDELDDLALTETGERRACASQKEVPAKDGVLVAKCGGCGRSAATEVRAVDHVVV